MTPKTVKFLTDEKGQKVQVVLDITEYEQMLEQIEELEDIRAADEAVASGETPIPYSQAREEIERSRK